MHKVPKSQVRVLLRSLLTLILYLFIFCQVLEGITRSLLFLPNPHYLEPFQINTTHENNVLNMVRIPKTIRTFVKEISDEADRFRD